MFAIWTPLSRDRGRERRKGRAHRRGNGRKQALSVDELVRPRGQVLGTGVQAPLGGLEVGLQERSQPSQPAPRQADPPGSHSSEGNKPGDSGPRNTNTGSGGDVLKTQVLRRAGPSAPRGDAAASFWRRALPGSGGPTSDPTLGGPQRQKFSLGEAEVCVAGPCFSRGSAGGSGLVQPLGLQALLGVWLRHPCASVTTRLWACESQASHSLPREDAVPSRLFPDHR